MRLVYSALVGALVATLAPGRGDAHLHGIGGSPDDWVGPGYQQMEIRAVLDSLITSGTIEPMIVVMPNGTNRYIGTFYMNSSVAGGWEDYIARDLVDHVDRTYRTLARRESRGIAGHSMGGYGSILMGMRHADVFSSVWAMNPCCLAMVADISADNPAWRRAAAIQTLDDFDAALEAQDFYPPAIIALASVFSPRPDLPPLYVELPFRRPSQSDARADDDPHPAVVLAHARAPAVRLERLL